MLKTLAAAALIPLAAIPVGASVCKPQAKPMPVKGEIVIKLGGEEQRKISLPKGDVYEVEGETSAPVRPEKQPRTVSDADANFQKMKDKLNENFKYMFELKSELEQMQNITQNKWNEYYALRDAYEKQLKKIIADWVTDNQYLS